MTYGARTYEELMGALVARKHALGLTNLDLDERGGFSAGYAAKLLCGSRTLGLVALGRLLKALDCQLLVVAADAQIPASVSENLNHFRVFDEHGEDIRFKCWGRLGGLAYAARTGKRRRREIASMGGKAAREAMKLRKLAAEQEQHRFEAALLRKLKKPSIISDG